MEQYVRERQKGKIIRDCLWTDSYIRLHPLSVAVLDTPEFQRLRKLHQLGCTQYVYPGAEHSRLVHSLGVAHLAHRCGAHIKNTQSSLPLDHIDLLSLELAGLCHDLGHGPFSHAFEAEFMSRSLPAGHKWDHEEMSLDLLEYIVDKHHIDMDPRLLKQTQDIIGCGKVSPHLDYSERPYLLQIVANEINGVDVDKIDYLKRDAYLTGCGYGNDFRSLMNTCKVLDGHICFKECHAPKVRMLFSMRAQMHEEVYTHPKTKALELMFTDAMLAADPVLHITERALRPDTFWQLNEHSVTEEMRIMDRLDPSCPCLAEATAILDRVESRRLYSLCGEVQVPRGMATSDKWRDVTEEEVTSCQRHDAGVMLQPGDIVVQNLKIDFTKGDKDPLSEVRLYDGFNKVSRCTDVPFLPQPLLQRKVRVFLKRDVPDPSECLKYQHAATNALYQAMKRRYRGSVRITRCKDPITAAEQQQQQHYHQQQQQEEGVGPSVAQQLQQPVVVGLDTPELLRTGPAAAALLGHAHHMNPRALFAGAGGQSAPAAAAAPDVGLDVLLQEGGDLDEDEEEVEMCLTQAMDVV